MLAAVWFINGFICKLLNLVPRHRQIVASLFGEKYAAPITTFIGIAEIIMAVWIITRYKSRLNAITQIIIITVMNIVEFLLVPDLLLWGKFNLLFALLLVLLIYYNEFVYEKKY